jgi:hypothetical protein
MLDDFKILFDREISLSIEQGFITASDFKGLSNDEIDEIESKFNIELPSIYKYFLSVCGNGGRLLEGNTYLNYYHHNLLDGREDVAEMMAEDINTNHDPIPDRAFFFADHIGSHYWYFVCDEDPDPIVYYIYYGSRFNHECNRLSKRIIGEINASIKHLQKRNKK